MSEVLCGLRTALNTNDARAGLGEAIHFNLPVLHSILLQICGFINHYDFFLIGAFTNERFMFFKSVESRHIIWVFSSIRVLGMWPLTLSPQLWCDDISWQHARGSGAGGARTTPSFQYSCQFLMCTYKKQLTKIKLIHHMCGFMATTA